MKGNLSDFTLKAKSVCKNVLKEYRQDLEMILGPAKSNSRANTRTIKKENDELSR